jgi:3-dehydroquinate synthetase
MPVNLNDLSKETLWKKEALNKRMLHDKKTVNGKINFVLLREIGKPFVCNEVTQQAVYETLIQLGAV